MTQPPGQPSHRWQIWVIAHGDYLRTPAGDIRLLARRHEAEQLAREIGGIVQVEGSPGLGGFDRALS